MTKVYPALATYPVCFISLVRTFSLFPLTFAHVQGNFIGFPYDVLFQQALVLVYSQRPSAKSSQNKTGMLLLCTSADSVSSMFLAPE